jgi:hypothetical protein
MFRKALKKLTGVTSKKAKPVAKRPSASAQPTISPSRIPHPPGKLLTAEGWKRLMMKKYRKS